MAWHPTRLGNLTAQYQRMSRAARTLTGEYVKHLPEGGPAEWVVVEYQDMTESLAMASLELQVSTSGPVIYAQLPEFTTAPRIYRNGKRAGDGASGSRFIVRGITYQAKNVEPNHRGGLTIQLNKDDCCTAVDQAFFDEMRDYLCSQEPSCGG